MDQKTEIAWNIQVELRKEILEAQRIRAQVIGFKITLVSTTVGLIIANKVGLELLAIPAFAAIFFDFLINSYSVSIKRAGYYCRTFIEPKLREYAKWPSNEPLWEEFMSNRKNRQRFSLVGNLGITIIAIITAAIGLAQSTRTMFSIITAISLVILFVFDLLAYLKPGWIAVAPSSRYRDKQGIIADNDK